MKFCDNCEKNKLSNYCENLKFDIQCIYIERISKIRVDPYILQNCKFESWREVDLESPPIHFLDIYEYVVNRKSFYSKEAFRAYKSLKSYDFFVSGHIKNTRWMNVISNENEEMNLFTSFCKHSMKVNEADLNVWLLVKNSEIITAHCSCMAGLSECCSHVGALLFFLNYASQKEEISVTSELAYWVKPGSSNKVVPKELSNIVVDTPRHIIKNDKITTDKIELPKYPPPMRNEKEFVDFLQLLKVTSPNNSSMYVTLQLQKEVTPKQGKRKAILGDLNVLQNLQNRAQRIQDEKRQRMDLDTKKDEIIEAFVQRQTYENQTNFPLAGDTQEHIDFFNTYVKVSVQKAVSIFQDTKCQSNLEWRKQRQIRVTGSIAYGLFTYTKGKKQEWQNKLESTIFQTFKGNEDTNHGRENESVAITELQKKYTVQNSNGLLIPVHCPWFAYSVDALIIRSNNEYQLVEVKCPVIGKTLSGVEMCKKVDCLRVKDENITVKKRHRYYGQIQLGLFAYNLRSAILVIHSSFNRTNEEFVVMYDHGFVTEMISRLSEMYFTLFLPFLIQNKDRLFITKP